jgi:cytochrome c oxidase assembly factor CtaG
MTAEIDPTVLSLLVAAGGLYIRAVRTLRARGRHISRWQQASWWGGMSLWAASLLGPIDGLSQSLFSAHMAQHLLVAELGAPLLLVGLRTPVLQFFLPRPVLVPLARQRRLRAALRKLRRPLVAIPLYTFVLYAWHLDFMFEGALRSPAVHALQHESFVVASVLVWWSALEPDRARVPGELWKIGHIVGARLSGMFLGMAFLAMRTPAYAGFYGEAARGFGLTPLEDQQIGGGMMLTLDAVIVMGACCYFFWRAAVAEDETRARASARAIRPNRYASGTRERPGSSPRSEPDATRDALTPLPIHSPQEVAQVDRARKQAS